MAISLTPGHEVAPCQQQYHAHAASMDVARPQQTAQVTALTTYTPDGSSISRARADRNVGTAVRGTFAAHGYSQEINTSARTACGMGVLQQPLRSTTLRPKHMVVQTMTATLRRCAGHVISARRLMSATDRAPIINVLNCMKKYSKENEYHLSRSGGGRVESSGLTP